MRVRETDGGASGLSVRPPPFPEHPGRAGSLEQLGRAEDGWNASQRPDGIVREQPGDENAAEQIDEASLARTIGPVERDLGDSPVRSRVVPALDHDIERWRRRGVGRRRSGGRRRGWIHGEEFGMKDCGAFVAGSSARACAAASARRGRRMARRFIGLKRLKRLKRLKEFKVERVKGKVAERGGGGVNAE